MFKRLEMEGKRPGAVTMTGHTHIFAGFIAQEVRNADDTGFMETTTLTTKKGKGSRATKTRAATRRKNLQKPVYVFVQAIKNDDAYKDYFNPDNRTETRMLKLHELVRS